MLWDGPMLHEAELYVFASLSVENIKMKNKTEQKRCFVS